MLLLPRGGGSCFYRRALEVSLLEGLTAIIVPGHGQDGEDVGHQFPVLVRLQRAVGRLEICSETEHGMAISE